MRLFCIMLTSTLITGCMNVERSDEISYDSYTESYDKASHECTENPQFVNKSLAYCLKIMDFQENVSNTDSGSTRSDEYGE